MVRFLDLKHAHLAMLDDLVDAFRELVDESAFVGGGRIREFEEAFAQYVGAEHCVAVANGTDAIEIVLEAIDAPSGGEIIVPANTFIATSEAVTRAGYEVVFADVSPNELQPRRRGCRATNDGSHRRSHRGPSLRQSRGPAPIEVALRQAGDLLGRGLRSGSRWHVRRPPRRHGRPGVDVQLLSGQEPRGARGCRRVP